MYSKNMKKVLFLSVLGLFVGLRASLAAESESLSVDAAALPINVSDKTVTAAQDAVANTAATNSLVSPSQAQQAPTANVAQQPAVANPDGNQNSTAGSAPVANSNFDLKVQAAGANVAANTTANAATKEPSNPPATAPAENPDLPKNIQYTVDPVENLGNGVLSQLDNDLFTQMSEIEKSTTLLTLELRREKLRNEIEAQKAIRLKNADDFEKQKEESKLQALERKKQIESKILQEKQLVLDKEKVLELIKQRKLLNAYMNQMLIQQQEWLKEKENLYAQLAAAEKEKQELVMLFRQRIDKVLAASAKNIQTAEAAKANFERIVKGLKSRNEQLRKRIEADAKIIKNTKSNLYIQAKSLEELKGKKAQTSAVAKDDDSSGKEVVSVAEDEKSEDTMLKSLSSEYAILGITGRSGVLSVDLIDGNGQSLSLKKGSLLPTGHVVSEIGSNYVRFTRDGFDDFLYVGKTIDGVIPNLDATPSKGN